MNILVLNCGSSSVRFQIISTEPELFDADGDKCLVAGYLERIGSQAIINFHRPDKPKLKMTAPLRDHKAALDYILRWIVSPEAAIQGVSSISDIHAVGHRVVHGGEKFKKCVLIDKAVIEQIQDMIDLAPLHNPANLKGILAERDLLGHGVPQVAVFDTAFHTTMPETSYLYAVPYQLYRRHGLRRYGFHGTSHRYVAYKYRKLLKITPQKVNIITLHLGNGCSACAIKGGKSIDTSMGLTPLEGLVMGTRAGDIDPSLIEFLHNKEGLTVSEIDTLLNKQSGLLGVSGLTHDMRDLLAEDRENNDRRAHLAIEIFCLRVRKYIGAYLAEMSGADAVIFAGGIGENSPEIRRRILSGLECFGLKMDNAKNEAMINGAIGEISTADSTLKAFVIITNEELLIARDTLRTLRGISPKAMV
ncbi:MAG: acetate kinase [Elusimicrobia bacterium]|nr:acetate kinase [Elusimicrobiota bacterium]